MALAHNTPPIVTRPVVYFDPKNLKCYPGSGTTLTNLSGDTVNGSMTSEMYNSSDGGYLDLNGTSDRITLSNSSAIMLPSGSRFTAEVWLYITSNPGNSSTEGIFSKAVLNTQTGYHLYMINGSTSITIVGRRSSSAGGFDNVSSSFTNESFLNVWNNIVWTYDGTTQKIYHNGELKSSGSSTRSFSSTATLEFGRYNSSGLTYNYFGGRLSGMKIYYPRTLDATEVAQNYNALRGRYGL